MQYDAQWRSRCRGESVLGIGMVKWPCTVHHQQTGTVGDPPWPYRYYISTLSPTSGMVQWPCTVHHQQTGRCPNLSTTHDQQPTRSIHPNAPSQPTLVTLPINPPYHTPS